MMRSPVYQFNKTLQLPRLALVAYCPGRSTQAGFCTVEALFPQERIKTLVYCLDLPHVLAMVGTEVTQLQR